MQVFFFIDGSDEYGIVRVEQFFAKLSRFSIVGWVNINTVHLAGTEVLQQTQNMVIAGFNQSMPKVTFRRAANTFHMVQARDTRPRQRQLLAPDPALENAAPARYCAQGFVPFQGTHRISVASGSVLVRTLSPTLTGKPYSSVSGR